MNVRAVTARERDGRFFPGFRPAVFPDSDDDRQQCLFILSASAREEAAAPRFDRIAHVRLDFEDTDDSEQVERVLLVNSPGKLILDCLEILRSGYGVETSLVTDHAAFHFRNARAAQIHDQGLGDRVKIPRRSIEALHGTLRNSNGDLIFSTDADDPNSVCRVFPEVSQNLELRFVIPAGNTASSARGWRAVDLVTPASTRSGSGIYVARRSLPNLGEPVPGRKFDGLKSRQKTFVPRIKRVLAETVEQPGLCWPIYTHLGGLDDDDNEDVEPQVRWATPSPYFEIAPLLELQDRVFNINGDLPPTARIWFTRATTLYDFALMLRSAPEHVRRPDGNTVDIASWHDSVLDKTLPRSPAELYGLTFYVDDPADAVVRLDGRAITHLTRNPPDETGRPSVTVAECEIWSLIFDRLDPTANLADEIVLDGDWRFTDSTEENPAHGRLIVGPSGAASLRLPLHGWRAI